MSFDVYLVSFADHRPHGIPRTAVRQAFGEHVQWEDDDGWTQYSGSTDGCSILLSPLKDDASLISGISINRPVGDQRLWDSLYRIMRSGNFALLFPGDSGPLIADPSVALHLPASLGQSVVVNSGFEIVKQIQSS
jgi:hypothetical protein